MDDYQFNTQLMRTLYLHCGFKTLAQFKQDCSFSSKFYYNIMQRNDVRMSYLLNICNKYGINPVAFFISPSVPTPLIHTAYTCHFVWESQEYLTLPDGSAQKIMKLLNQTTPFLTRQRFLRHGDDSTIKASDIIYILNTYNLRPDQFFIPKE